MYVRFVVGTNQDSPTQQTGVVTELRRLRDSSALPSYEQEHVDEVFDWLNDHLPCPPFESKNWSKDAISWFKDSAQDMIGYFRDMIAILEEHDRPVRMITTDRPGMILYEDEFQVVLNRETTED